MKKLLSSALCLTVTALAASAFGAETTTSHTTLIKIGKVQVFPANEQREQVKFSMDNAGTFNGCTADPTYMYVETPQGDALITNRLDAVVQVLLYAKDHHSDVRLGYVVDRYSRCNLRGIEVE